MIQFFAPDILTTLTLPESDSLHAVKVLRMNSGDLMRVIDGKGNVYSCRLADAHRKHASVEIIDCQKQPLPWGQRLTVAVAPTKHLDRMEWLVEKLTEIGVNNIVPILCERSERRDLKVERLEKIAVSAMKQSLKAVLPSISPLTPVAEVIGNIQSDSQSFVGYCDETFERKDFANAYLAHRNATIFIGPEGDFTIAEIELMLQKGVIPVTFGNNRLRTETAALYALTACHVLDSIK